MNDTTKIEGQPVVTSATPTEVKAGEGAVSTAQDPITPAPSQDPIKDELTKVKGRKYTEAEQAAHKLKMLATRATELGLDPLEVLKGGTAKAQVPADDDAPLTVGMLKELQKQEAVVTAKSLAEAQIADEAERELVIHHLEHTIKSSGNPTEDLVTARRIVNSVRTERILQDEARRAQPHSGSTASGAPARVEAQFEPTAFEATMMRPPFSLTKEQILEARKRAQQK